MQGAEGNTAFCPVLCLLMASPALGTERVNNGRMVEAVARSYNEIAFGLLAGIAFWRRIGENRNPWRFETVVEFGSIQEKLPSISQPSRAAAGESEPKALNRHRKQNPEPQEET
jgi:hypothetical protein